MTSKIIICFLFFSISLAAQISPGELTTAHADLEGLSNCTKCHELGEKVLNSKCLDCHNIISNLIKVGEGFHSSKDVKGEKCSKCHPEHFGRSFEIVKFEPKLFDHNKTTFRLTGSHTRIECQACHQIKYILDTELKKKDNTYLGLNVYCFSCHEDNHRKTLGDNCSACHGMEKFKPADNFDHNNAKFILTGKHLNVTCIKCHPKQESNGKVFQKFVGLQFQNCLPCHSDVHKGKFGLDCKNCHVTSSFAVINKKRFNHDRTNYPLIGRHKSVKCDDCHKTNTKIKLKYQKCTDCHPDYHKAQFIVNNTLQDCVDCHNEYGFRPSTISSEKHNKFKLRLSGSHLAIPCQSCHLDSLNWKFRNLGLECIDCHKNVHGQEIVEKFLPGNRCLECHSAESWDTINFNHDLTEFVLAGKHRYQRCRACHNQAGNSSKAELIFKSLKKNCEECHKDIHNGQFIDGVFSDCLGCHTYNDWKPDKFDHEKTKFSLKGGHEKVRCIACHPVVASAELNFVKYKLENFKCSACHL